MLDILTPGQWKLLHAKMRAGMAALELVADDEFAKDGPAAARPYERTMEDLLDVLAVA